MELTNLLFAVLLGFVVVSGTMIFFNGMANSYPNVRTADPGLTNISAQMNATTSQMDTMLNQSTTQSLDMKNFNAVSAIFGYVTGAVSSLITLALTPTLFLNMINAISGIGGYPLVPQFVIYAIGTAVAVIALLGFLFFLLKVR